MALFSSPSPPLLLKRLAAFGLGLGLFKQSSNDRKWQDEAPLCVLILPNAHAEQLHVCME